MNQHAGDWCQLVVKPGSNEFFSYTQIMSASGFDNYLKKINKNTMVWNLRTLRFYNVENILFEWESDRKKLLVTTQDNLTTLM